MCQEDTMRPGTAVVVITEGWHEFSHRGRTGSPRKCCDWLPDPVQS